MSIMDIPSHEMAARRGGFAAVPAQRAPIADAHLDPEATVDLSRFDVATIVEAGGLATAHTWDALDAVPPPAPREGMFAASTALGRAAVEVAPAGEQKPRFVEVSGGRLQLVTFFDGDPRYAELTAKIDAGQRKAYKEQGVWKPDAKGTPIRGNNVEIMAFLNEAGEPVEALRKVHARTPEEVRQLPSFQKFEEAGALDPAKVAEFEACVGEREVVEIAGLWKDSRYHADAKLALFRAALHDSIERGEVWFMGTVGTVYRDLTSSYGDKVVHTMSNRAISVRDEDASAKTRLRAIYVDPATFYDDMIDQIEAARASGNDTTRFLREFMLWHFLSGLDRNNLHPDTLSRLQRMSHGRSTR